MPTAMAKGSLQVNAFLISVPSDPLQLQVDCSEFFAPVVRVCWRLTGWQGTGGASGFPWGVGMACPSGALASCRSADSTGVVDETFSCPFPAGAGGCLTIACCLTAGCPLVSPPSSGNAPVGVGRFSASTVVPAERCCKRAMARSSASITVLPSPRALPSDRSPSKPSTSTTHRA